LSCGWSGHRVHVGAQCDSRPVAVSQHPDDSGSADVRRDFETGLPQLVCSLIGGAVLLGGELRVAIASHIPREEIGRTS
jgi:hypothetical protein